MSKTNYEFIYIGNGRCYIIDQLILIWYYTLKYSVLNWILIIIKIIWEILEDQKTINKIYTSMLCILYNAKKIIKRIIKSYNFRHLFVHIYFHHILLQYIYLCSLLQEKLSIK